jgi:DNA-binding response OmpR family regulator
MPHPARILVVETPIADLRRKLSEGARAPRPILTVSGRGCAFGEDQR